MRVVFGAVGLVIALGCSSGSSSVACHAGADCASGVCLSNGTCGPVTFDDAGKPVDSGLGADTSTDALAGDSAGPGCTANGDDVITASEVPLSAGLHATFRTATNVTFDTTGQMVNGVRTWDLSVALPGDQNAIVETLPVAGAWYASSFPTASYATKLSASSDLLGVFRTGPTALEILGIVSPMSGISQTNVAYSPPAASLQFPLQVGAAWKTTSSASGTLNGGAIFYTDTYDSLVDQKGTLKTPFGSFPVLRVRIVLTHTLGIVPLTTRSYAFVTDCFGNVATITSQSNEPNVEFTSAAEVKRIAP
jgi:hypothetical protein